MIQVGINGYGTIGKRVADAVRAQPDMAVAGVAKTRPNYEAFGAIETGYPLYTADPAKASAFREAGMPAVGTVEDLLAECDVVVDATPSGVGAENKALYDRHGVPAIFQGGEDPDVAEVSFNARANYSDAVGADSVRVVSCNTTGLSRLVTPLEEEYGVEKVRATLVRRGGDPSQNSRGPINDIVPNPVTVPSHHGPDVNTILPDMAIDTLGLKVPATLMHVHSINVTLDAPATAAEVREIFEGESRLFVVPARAGIDGPAKLKEYALDAGRPRGDVWENCVWAESVGVRGNDLYCFQAIHQEADVVPENVDAIRAITGTDNAAESVATTDERLGMGFHIGDGARPRHARRAVAGWADA